jgi:hypothetical protein
VLPKNNFPLNPVIQKRLEPWSGDMAQL